MNYEKKVLPSIKTMNTCATQGSSNIFPEPRFSRIEGRNRQATVVAADRLGRNPT